MLHSQDPNLEIYTLANGLTIYFKPNSYPKNRVYMELMVEVGARHETKEINGISHFIEHMAFKTTKHFKNGQVFQELKEAGVSQGHHANAYTGFGRTVYHFYVPTKAEIIEKALTFLGEFAFHQAFLPGEVSKERKVILEELRRAKDKDYAYYTGMLASVFPKDSPLGQNTVLGNTTSLQHITPERLQEFYEQFYVPNNMVLTIVGDCTYNDIEKHITKIFGPAKKRALPAVPETIPVERSKPETYIHAHKEYKEYYCGLIFARQDIPNRSTEERTILFHYVLLQWVLRERFHDLLQQESRISSMGVNKDTVNFLPTSLLFAYVYSQGSSLKRGLSLLLSTLHHMALHGPSTEELDQVKEKAREYIASSLKEAHKTPHPTFAQSIQQAHLGGFSYFTPEEDLGFFDSIVGATTPEDMQKTIGLFFDLQTNPLLTFTIPSKDKIDTKDMLALYERIRKSSLKKGEGVVAAPMQFPLPAAPKKAISSKKQLKDIDATVYTLANGIEVFVKHTDLEPDTIYCSLTTLGGQLLETPETKGLSDAYVTTILRGGTKHHSYREVQRYLSPKKLFLSVDKWSSIGMMFSLTAAPHTLEAGLAVMVSHLTEPGFREYDCKVSLNENIQAMRQHETSKEFAAEMHFSSLLFGSHPVGYSMQAADLRKITLGQIKNFHKKAFPTTSSKALLVGNLSGVDVEALLSRTLGALPSTTTALPKSSRSYKFPRSTTKKIIQKGEENKALIRLAYHGPAADDSWYCGFSLYTDILTELLEERIREELGGTYSIYAANGASSFLPEGSLEICFECDPKRADQLTREVQELLVRAPKLIQEVHVARALQPVLSWFEELQEENDLWLRSGRYLALGRDPRWLFGHMEAMAKTTLQDILAVAERYSDPGLPYVLLKVIPRKTTKTAKKKSLAKK